MCNLADIQAVCAHCRSESPALVTFTTVTGRGQTEEWPVPSSSSYFQYRIRVAIAALMDTFGSVAGAPVTPG